MATAAKKKPRSASRRPKARAGGRAGPQKRQSGAGSNAVERSAPPLAEVDAEVLEFIEAIDRFKRENGRPFPSWSEVLMVLRELGYQRGGA